MIKELMSTLFGSGRTIETQEPIIEEHADIMDSAPETPKTLPSLHTEIQVLARECGGLVKGGRIEITLHRILELCPRSRKKSDAYLGLKRKLKDDWGVELVIISKSKKYEDRTI